MPKPYENTLDWRWAGWIRNISDLTVQLHGKVSPVAKNTIKVNHDRINNLYIEEWSRLDINLSIHISMTRYFHNIARVMSPPILVMIARNGP